MGHISVVLTAFLLTSLVIQTSAELTCGPSPGQEHQYGDYLTFWCQAKVPENGESPMLQWYSGGLQLADEYQKLNDTTIVRKIAKFNVTREDDSRIFRCLQLNVEAQPGAVIPTAFIEECPTYIRVQYGSFGIQFEPDPSTFNDSILHLQVGDMINCSASGRPEPSFEWIDVDEQDYVPGPVLEVRENMAIDPDPEVVDTRVYRCKARNSIEGQPYEVVKDVKFIIDTEPGKKKDDDGAESWVVPVVLLVIVFLIVIVLAVVFFIKYTRDKNHPRKLHEDSTGSFPDKTSPSRSTIDAPPDIFNPRAPPSTYASHPGPSGQRSPSSPRDPNKPINDDDRYRLPPPRTSGVLREPDPRDQGHPPRMPVRRNPESERPRAKERPVSESLSGYGDITGQHAPGKSFI